MRAKIAITALFLLMFILLCRPLKAEEMPGQGLPSLRPAVEYGAEGLPEPFQLEEEPELKEEAEIEAPLPKLTIQGIVWGASFPQAIINNKIVRKGDVIEDVRVEDIAKNGLTVSFRGKEFKLPSPAAGDTQVPQKGPQGGEE